MPELNWLAVLAATIAAFVLGGVWYSPLLFAKRWQAAAGLSDEQLKSANPALVFGGSFVLAFVASAMFAMFLGPRPELLFATSAGFAAGLCWVGTSFGINGLFQREPLSLVLINAGYHTLQFTLIGLVLGLWH
jgi:hypothetical protein